MLCGFLEENTRFFIRDFVAFSDNSLPKLHIMQENILKVFEGLDQNIIFNFF